jgi:hypothetical protein
MATIDTAAISLATPRKLVRGWGMMSIPFEEFEQSNSRTCQVTASAVDTSRFLLAENQTPKAQNPRFLSKPGVLSTSNLAVKERFELNSLFDQQGPYYGAFSVHSSTIE